MTVSSMEYLVRENIKHPMHGTQSGYSYRCRCRRCRDAHAAAMREHRQKAGGRPRKPLLADDPRHGTENAYSNYDCRCDACREAHRVAHLAYRKRRAAREWAGLAA